MNNEDKVQQSFSRQDRVVFKNSVNEHNTLFGGLALKYMDEVAYLSAHRFAGKDVLTLSAGPVKFKKPIPYKSFICIEGRVVNAGRVKLTINVKVYIENKETGIRTEAIDGDFVFVAVDKNLKPVRLM